MRRVVVNSTPIIALAKVEKLDVLKAMYGQIIIPEAVFSEVTAKDDCVKDLLLKNNEWIKVKSIVNFSEKAMFKARLHDGEVEVMVLAKELKADVVIIDDYAARKTAEYIGLNLTGTIGILIKAKRKGLIDLVMPIVQVMEQNGIYYSEQLKEQIRNLANEWSDLIVVFLNIVSNVYRDFLD